MDRVKIGMVGSQFAADLHLRNLSKLRGAKVDIVAVASKHKEHAAPSQKKFEIRISTTITDLSSIERISI